MDPDDNMNNGIIAYPIDTSDYTISDVDLGKYTITVTGDDTFSWVDDGSKYDSTFSIMPEKDSPSVYTSFEQREQHDKYPALKKAWEDYLNMYNLTQGDPPIVD
jgi:hypothetical protein